MCRFHARWIFTEVLLLLISGHDQTDDLVPAATLEVRVVSVQMLDPSVALGLVWIGAAVHLAVQRANEQYAQRGLRFVVRPVDGMYNQTCLSAAAEGIPLFTNYYYRHNLDQHTPDTCDIFFTNTCADYFQQLCLSSGKRFLSC
ncbi:uncharacterized protein LOC129595037 [Paramacrobiotus metropolitanus]|uniref:uncharacterized protein LOC129595037 n=1 Tax=Paramacrobiotus metropolitanus TaxID=2943436 RepID=UPI002445C62C|nr:uncharacterized protein LOC129595037 [Paramacrobiotus metropolitanus]